MRRLDQSQAGNFSGSLALYSEPSVRVLSRFYYGMNVPGLTHGRGGLGSQACRSGLRSEGETFNWTYPVIRISIFSFFFCFVEKAAPAPSRDPPPPPDAGMTIVAIVRVLRVTVVEGRCLTYVGCIPCSAFSRIVGFRR